jgi:exonuclease SbcD
MRLLHTADLHLGKILHEQSLLEDQAHALDQIAAELERGGYDVFLVAGDVFDRSVPPPEAIVLWDAFLGRIALSCPSLVTIVISGNHDSAVRLSWSAGFLAAHRIHVRTRTEDLHVPVTVTADGREWDFFAVPFLQAGSLASDDSPVLRSQQDLWKLALERLKAARRPRASAVLVAHLFAQGGAESDSERVFLGEAEQIPASWLTGWDYAALGHLHRPQEPEPGVRYSGSPLAYSFSEAGQQKSLIRWTDGTAEVLPLKPLHPLTRLEASYEELCTSPQYDAYREHWLEITLTDAALVSGPLERLRPRFPRLLSLRQAPAPAAAASGVERRQTGDLAGDAVAFLSFLGRDDAETLRPRLVEAARAVAEAGS